MTPEGELTLVYYPLSVSPWEKKRVESELALSRCLARSAQVLKTLLRPPDKRPSLLFFFLFIIFFVCACVPSRSAFFDLLMPDSHACRRMLARLVHVYWFYKLRAFTMWRNDFMVKMDCQPLPNSPDPPTSFTALNSAISHSSFTGVAHGASSGLVEAARGKHSTQLLGLLSCAQRCYTILLS